MSLFLRRRIQRLVNELDGKIPFPAISRIVNSLNGGDVQPLATEWEVILLWAFTRRFYVEYEPGHANAAKPDLIVSQNVAAGPLFAADVRCVSDIGSHRANPVDRLSDLLASLKIESRLSGSVEWHVAGEMKGDYQRAKMNLCLPTGEDAWQDVADRIKHFYASCQRSGKRERLSLSDLAPGLTVGYDPSGHGLSGGFPSYVATYNIRRNPVANALSTKRRQMADACVEGFTGIILCDGGCDLLHTQTSGVDALSLKDVIQNFLRHERDVDFVVTLAIESSYPSPLLGQHESHTIKPRFFSLHSEEKIGPVDKAFRSVLPLLPPAEMSPENARNGYARDTGRNGHRMQPMKQSGKEISVSIRWLMELLSGSISLEQAFQRYGITPQSTTGRGANPFRRMLAQHKLPENVWLVRDEDLDDDTVIFQFSDHDAAVGPFVTLRSGKASEPREEI